LTDEVRIVPRAQRDGLGEGPHWSARAHALYWVDIIGQRLNRLSLADDTIAHWDMAEPIGWAIEREAAPGLVVGLQSGFHLLELDQTPCRLTLLKALETDRPMNRMNDAKADPRGRIWAGTMPMDMSGPTGGFYRFDPNLSVARVDDGYHIPNGPAISPDCAWLLHTDSALRTIYRLPVHDDGSLGPRTDFIQFEPHWGHPDGMTFDIEGGLWVAHWGAGCVSRFDEQGRRERWIDLPASQITSCTFAGVGLDRMFVTSAADGIDEQHGGALFEVDPGCTGLPTCTFGG